MYSFDLSLVYRNNGRILSIPENSFVPFKVECSENHVFDIFYSELLEGRWCDRCYLNNFYCPGNRIVVVENALRELGIRSVKKKFHSIFKYDLYFENEEGKYFVLFIKDEEMMKDIRSSTLAKIKSIVDANFKIIVLNSEAFPTIDKFISEVLSFKESNVFVSDRFLFDKIFDFDISMYRTDFGIFLSLSVTGLTSIISGKLEQDHYKKNVFPVVSSQRSKPPFGYRFVSKEEPFAEDAEEMAALEKIRQIISLDPMLNVTQICKKLNEMGVKCRKAKFWYPSTLKKVMLQHNLIC